MANVYETKASDSQLRKYFHSGDLIVPILVPDNEVGRIYLFHGWVKLGQEFDFAWEEEHVSKTKKRIYVKPDTLMDVDLEWVARKDISLGDYIVVTPLDVNYNLDYKNCEIYSLGISFLAIIAKLTIS